MFYIAGEQISGKALCQLDRETFKEIGIKSIGKQLNDKLMSKVYLVWSFTH